MKRSQLGMERFVCSPAKISLTRVHLDQGGYADGRYFGQGAPLYAYDNGDSWGHLRASSRAAAKARLKAKCPTAKFYR
jgi:hypothetical protein